MLIVTISNNKEQLKEYGVVRLKGLNGSDDLYEYEVVEIRRGKEVNEKEFQYISTIKHRFLDGTTKLTGLAMTEVAKHREPDAAN